VVGPQPTSIATHNGIASSASTGSLRRIPGRLQWRRSVVMAILSAAR
jgi:hypothetical protein